ncbi:MAG: TetR/AcrR family transcriptional regulator [Actinomycetales bacterium]
MATRKYQQHLRAESAEETRRRILDAVSQRLREAPTEPLSLDQVARIAKVARSTIYTVFGSRAGLFDAFTKDLWARTGIAELTAAVASSDARTHLREGVAAASRMLARDRDIYRVLHSMAKLDPESVGGAVQTMDEERRGGMAFVAKHLAEEGELRDDVSEAEATDVLWLLCSFDSFDALYTDRGLSLADTTRWLTAAIERTICR